MLPIRFGAVFSALTIVAFIATTLRVCRADGSDGLGGVEPSSFALQRSYHVGEVVRYRVDLHSTFTGVQNGSRSFTFTMRELTRSAKPDGSLKLQCTFEDLHANINGVEQDLTLVAPKITFTRDKNGKTKVKVSGKAKNLANELETLYGAIKGEETSFQPSGPVKIGDTWRTQMQGVTSIHSSATITASGAELVQGRKGLRLALDVNNAFQPRNGIRPAQRAAVHGFSVLDLTNARTLLSSVEFDTAAADGSHLTEQLDLWSLESQPEEHKPSK